MSYLQDFLFTPDRAHQPVRSLSGGERNRLLLAKLFTKPANLLVLDEPTNDLDMETLELLEEQLLAYEGTLLLVSHDRAFLDNVVTSCLVFEGDGKVGEYVGGYSDWLTQRSAPAEQERASKSKAAPAPKKTEPAPPDPRSSATRNSASWRACRCASRSWSRCSKSCKNNWATRRCTATRRTWCRRSRKNWKTRKPSWPRATNAGNRSRRWFPEARSRRAERAKVLLQSGGLFQAW